MPVILDRKILEMPARKSRRLTSIVQVQYKYSTSILHFFLCKLCCFVSWLVFNLDFKKWRARLACSFEDMEHLCFLVTRVLQTFLQEESEMQTALKFKKAADLEGCSSPQFGVPLLFGQHDFVREYPVGKDISVEVAGGCVVEVKSKRKWIMPWKSGPCHFSLSQAVQNSPKYSDACTDWRKMAKVCQQFKAWIPNLLWLDRHRRWQQQLAATRLSAMFETKSLKPIRLVSNFQQCFSCCACTTYPILSVPSTSCLHIGAGMVCACLERDEADMIPWCQSESRLWTSMCMCKCAAIPKSCFPSAGWANNVLLVEKNSWPAVRHEIV